MTATTSGHALCLPCQSQNKPPPSFRKALPSPPADCWHGVMTRNQNAVSNAGPQKPGPNRRTRCKVIRMNSTLRRIPATQSVVDV